MKNFPYWSIALIILLAPFVNAHASDISLQTSIAIGNIKYDAKEFSATGFVTNRETGRIPFVKLGLRYPLTDAYFVDASLRHADNRIKYDGYTQIGLPIKTNTQLSWQQAELNFGYHQKLTDAVNFEYLLGLGQRRLDRDIKPTLGALPLREILSSTRLNLSAKFQHAIARQTHWHIGIALQPTLRQDLTVDAYGLYDLVTLKPAKTVDKRLFVGASHAFTKHWRVQVDLGLESIKPGASSSEIWRKNSVPVASVRYPGSQQKAGDFSIQLAAQF